MAFQIESAATRPSDVDALVLGAYRGEVEHIASWPGAAAAVAQGWNGGARSRPLVLYPGTPARVVVVGLGPKAEVTARSIRRAVATGVRAARVKGVRHIGVELPAAAEHRGAAVAGVGDGLYSFTAYRAPRDEEAAGAPVVTLVGVGDIPAREQAAVQAAVPVRDWVNRGSNDKPPERLADLMTESFDGLGVVVERLGAPELTAMGAGGILGVGQGSAHPPVMLLAKYAGAPGDSRTLALVGKGITFDSGGLSLKTGQGMMTMKTDMAGAAAVMGAVAALAAAKAPVNVWGIGCLAENMPDGNAQRPGDVIRTLDGTTVEVLNTDAEGRLVLCDGVALAKQRGAAAIVDIATLTGAAAAALGGERAAYLATDERLRTLVEAAARKTGEWVWEMPADEQFRRNIDSSIADMKNVSSAMGGGMQVGGLFVGAFAQGVPWLHLDIAGTAFQAEPRHGSAQGSTAFGVGLLTELASGYFA